MTQLPLTGNRQSQSDLLQLASQGDVKAIATLMNRHLMRQQMTAQVAWEENRLHVLIEAVRVVPPEPLISVIHRTFLKLQIHRLRAFKVSCCQTSTNQIAWTHERQIASHRSVVVASSPQAASHTRQPTAAPISLQRWMSQKAQASLAELIQPIPATNNVETELRFLRFAFSASETALLSLGSIRQVMKVHPQSLLTVPDMPAFVVGIGNFHGEMLWMVDLGLQLGFQGVNLGWSNLRSQPHFPSLATPLQERWMAIVIQAQGKSLGLIVPQVIDIERHDPTQLQPPTMDLFPSTLLPFIQGYLVRSSSPILDANELIADRRLQVHAV